LLKNVELSVGTRAVPSAGRQPADNAGMNNTAAHNNARIPARFRASARQPTSQPYQRTS